MKNQLTNFMIFCSGANKSILKRCPSDISKYSGIGATVFFTAALAALTGGFAIYSVFSNYIAAGVFAILWALIIFNLDRYIVSTMKKRDAWYKEFFLALPRIILAIFISIVISKPLELAIFQSRIDAYMMEHNEGKKKEMSNKNKQYINETFDKPIEKLKQEIASKESSMPASYQILMDKLEDLEKEKAKTQSSIHALNKPLYSKIKSLESSNGTGVFSEDINNLYWQINRNNGLLLPINNQIISVNQQIETEYKSYREDLALLKERNNKLIADLEVKKQTKTEELMKKETEGGGIYDACTKLPDRISAMGVICANDTALSGMSWFIILLLICIETAPVFTKLISARSPYDDLLQLHEYNYVVKRNESMKKLEEKTNQRIQIAVEAGNYSVAKELEANKEFTNKVIRTEMELAQDILDKYKERQKAEIAKNIDKYITLSAN